MDFPHWKCELYEALVHIGLNGLKKGLLSWQPLITSKNEDLSCVPWHYF